MQNTVHTWLKGLPGLQDLTLESLQAKEGASGLFCQGQKILSRSSNIWGETQVRKSLTFKLCLHSASRQTPSFFLNLDTSGAPILGQDQTVTVTQGHMTKDDGRGLCRFEATITFTFTRKE